MRLLGVAATIVLITMSMQTSAQFGGGRRGGGEGRSRSSGAAPGQSEAPRLSANDRMRLQLTKTHAALKLTSEQEVLWEVFQKQAMVLLEEPASVPAAENEKPLARIAHNENALKARLAMFERLDDAARKLYSGFSDEQKSTADAMLPVGIPSAYPNAAP